MTQERRNNILLNIEIRRPRSEDIEELDRFFVEVIKDTFDKEGLASMVDQIAKEIEDKRIYLRQDLESNGEKRYFLLALDGGKIVGTICYGPASRLIARCTNDKLKDVVEVGTVFVHPSYQKQGIGTLLLNVIYLTLLARGIREFCLDSGYARAQNIWKKKLGEPGYIMKDFWGRGYDHMIWHKLMNEIPIVFRA